MAIEKNKEIARKMMQSLFITGLDQSLFSADAEWWNSGSGTKLVTQFIQDTSKFKGFRGGQASFETPAIIAEGDRVMVEAKGHIPLKSGIIYENHYVFLLTVVDGKITRVHEYADSLYAATALKGIFYE